MSVHYLVIPGAGSSGLAWEEAAELLGAPIVPVPDAPDVAAMAAEVEPGSRRCHARAS